jgi:hemerythrin
MPAHPLLSRLAQALRDAATASDVEFESRFRELTAEIESAFSAQEAWMENMRLPSLKSQREQHARVLQGMHHAHAALLQGQAAASRRAVVSLLPSWLPAHFASMRQGLASRETRNALVRITAPRRTGSGARQFRQ